MGLSAPMRHCWDRNHYEQTFIHELAESCYREKTFVFRQQELYLIPIFLGCDKRQIAPSSRRADASILAPIDLIRNIRLYFESTGNGWTFTLKILQVLLQLKHKATIQVLLNNKLIISPNVMGDIKRYINTFKPLFPILRSLRHRGHTVKARFGSFRLLQPTQLPTEVVADLIQASIDAVSDHAKD
ncbi:hypothetical protein N0V90_004446 [Kalmusia sp. IMI 367209]|nr:hypothetical protein N0V90_004446 [Kalmusia sp. IMI 367209]